MSRTGVYPIPRSRHIEFWAGKVTPLALPQGEPDRARVGLARRAGGEVLRQNHRGNSPDLQPRHHQGGLLWHRILQLKKNNRCRPIWRWHAHWSDLLRYKQPCRSDWLHTSNRIYAFVESEVIESIFRSSEFSFSGSKLLTLTGIRDLVLHLDLPCETPYEKVIQGFYLQQPFFSQGRPSSDTRNVSRPWYSHQGGSPA